MKIICFCSSQRFRSDLEKFIKEFKEIAKSKGRSFIVLDPEFETRSTEFEKASEKERIKDISYRREIPGVVYNHLFRKVVQADVVFIFNKNGYIGANTYGELFAAAATGKIIFALDKKFLMSHGDELYEEPAAGVLIHDTAKTPKEFFEKIK